MLAKLKAALVVLSALLSKLRAEVVAGCLLVVTYGPTVVAFLQSAPGTSAAALVPDTKSMIEFCVGLAALLHQAKPDSSFGNAVDAKLSKAAATGQAGFATFGIVRAICTLFVVGTLLTVVAKCMTETPHRAPTSQIVVQSMSLQACSGTNGNQVINDLQPGGACILAAMASGQIDFTNFAKAALQLAKLCVGATAESIVAVLSDVLGPHDAGIGAAASTLLAKVPASTIAGVRDAAAKMHGTFEQMSAQMAAGAVQ